jgi:hypothetical protein
MSAGTNSDLDTEMKCAAAEAKPRRKIFEARVISTGGDAAGSARVASVETRSPNANLLPVAAAAVHTPARRDTRATDSMMDDSPKQAARRTVEAARALYGAKSHGYHFVVFGAGTVVALALADVASDMDKIANAAISTLIQKAPEDLVDGGRRPAKWIHQLDALKVSLVGPYAKNIYVARPVVAKDDTPISYARAAYGALKQDHDTLRVSHISLAAAVTGGRASSPQAYGAPAR